MSKNFVSLACAIACSFIWGTAFIAQDMGMDFIGPYTFSAVRLALGFLALLPFFFIFEYQKVKNTRLELKFIIGYLFLLGFFLAGGNIFQQVAASAKGPYSEWMAARAASGAEEDKLSAALLGDVMVTQAKKEMQTEELKSKEKIAAMGEKDKTYQFEKKHPQSSPQAQLLQVYKKRCPQRFVNLQK